MKNERRRSWLELYAIKRGVTPFILEIREMVRTANRPDTAEEQRHMREWIRKNERRRLEVNR